MKAKEFIPASKPRNFVAKNAPTTGAGRHKDSGKKKDMEQGKVKHKKDLVPMEGWSNKMVAQRTGQAPTPYSVYVKGREWKSFSDDDHAEAVANKLRARFKQEGKDPSVITVAPTDIPEGVAEADIPTRKTLGKDETDLPLYTVAVDCGEDGTYTVKVHASDKFGALATASKIVRRQYDAYPESARIVGQGVNEFAPGPENNNDDLTDEAYKDGQRLGISSVDGMTLSQAFDLARWDTKYTVPFSYGWRSGRQFKIKNAKNDGVDLVLQKNGSLVRAQGVAEASALEKFRKGSAEREKKHNDAEKAMNARHARGEEDMKGSIDRLEKHLNNK